MGFTIYHLPLISFDMSAFLDLECYVFLLQTLTLFPRYHQKTPHFKSYYFLLKSLAAYVV